ncbi:hypothetical protein FE257_005496 [Aspergillus nanangensis]|uniref:Uncharacterized protein n=1 Tax=Aspergillus nanangensis TaxID=2582783 RepID=A0AAD4CBG2_ASPNN|nr:hypothetical protein FE257_005496 [Aspergillus nanangensis]
MAHPEALNILTTTVNQTLVETGRFFRSGASTHSKAQLKRSIPIAHEKFQSALDELSQQIFIAKTFLERDYDAIQAKKATLKPPGDVIMSEPEVKPGPEPVSQPEKAIDINPALPNPTEEATSPELPRADGDSATQNPPEQAVITENTGDTLAHTDQPASGAGDLNFSSALNNSEGPNDFDLNLDFGDDNMGNENFLSGANASGMSMPGGNEQEKINDPSTNTIPDAQATDPNPPAGGDALDLELEQAGVLGGQQSDGQMGNNNEDAMALGQSSFDDLFMESENFGGEGVGDPSLLEGDGLMNINEIDDSWFQ